MICVVCPYNASLLFLFFVFLCVLFYFFFFVFSVVFLFFFQAEDGIRYLVRSRGLGDVYKRQPYASLAAILILVGYKLAKPKLFIGIWKANKKEFIMFCLLYTSDAADERSSVDLGGRRIIKKKKIEELSEHSMILLTMINIRHTREKKHKLLKIQL